MKKYVKILLYSFFGVGLILYTFLIIKTPVMAFTEAWNEDFEDYTEGYLTNNPKWNSNTIYQAMFNVVSHHIFSGSKAVEVNGNTCSYPECLAVFIPEIPISSGTKEYNVMLKSNTAFWSNGYTGLTLNSLGAEITIKELYAEDNKWTLRYSGGIKNCETKEWIGTCSNCLFGNDDTLINSNEWIQINYKIDFNNYIYYLNAQTSTHAWTEQCGWLWLDEPIEITGLTIFTWKTIGYFDYFNFPTPPEIAWGNAWGINPESETEITNLNKLFTFGYNNLIGDTLYIAFKNKETGIFSNAKMYNIENIGESGEITLNLQDFQIEKNGNWFFYAEVMIGTPEIIQGLYLTGRYSFEMSGDITDSTYYLKINVEGFEPIFSMSDFENWYLANAKFDEPTDMFSAVAGFFSPIFSLVGEFGSRISNYFQVNEAYTRGYEIGKVIPIFSYYVNQINNFFGGFPIIQMLLVVILLLIGIFIFKVIMKFIPFIG